MNPASKYVLTLWDGRSKQVLAKTKPGDGGRIFGDGTWVGYELAAPYMQSGGVPITRGSVYKLTADIVGGSITDAMNDFGWVQPPSSINTGVKGDCASFRSGCFSLKQDEFPSERINNDNRNKSIHV